MTIQFLNKEGEATLTLGGRLDTAASAKAISDIEQLLGAAGSIHRECRLIGVHIKFGAPHPADAGKAV